MRTYFQKLIDQSGTGWNRFWYTPSDPYMLGLMRLLTGLVFTYWYLTLLPDISHFFAQDGLLPLEKIQSLRNNGQTAFGDQVTLFSYWNYVSSPGAVQLAYYAGLLAILAFTVGLYGRISAALTYLVLISYAHRAPMLLGSFEQTLPLLMLGYCVGPCSASFSVDRWLNARSVRTAPAKYKPLDRSSWLTTVGLRLIQIHLTLITVASVVAKLRYDSWWTGGATWLLMVRPESRAIDFTGAFRHLLDFTLAIRRFFNGAASVPEQPEKIMFLDAWTHMVIMFQLLFPLTVWNSLLRPLVIAISAVVWLLIALLSGLVPYCALMFIAGLAFVPGQSLRVCVACCCGGKKTVQMPIGSNIVGDQRLASGR